MKPIDFPESNSKLLAGDIPNCNDLPVYKNGKLIISCWELEDGELEEIQKNKKVYLTVFSPITAPPVDIRVHTPFINENKPEESNVIHE